MRSEFLTPRNASITFSVLLSVKFTKTISHRFCSVENKAGYKPKELSSIVYNAQRHFILFLKRVYFEYSHCYSSWKIELCIYVTYIQDMHRKGQTVVYRR